MKSYDTWAICILFPIVERSIITLVLATSTLSASAENITVDDDGLADYDNIQEAVDAAEDGDVIWVAAGVYTSDHPTHVVDMKGKAITLGSIIGPDFTIIDGEHERRGIVCVNGETSDTVISGIRIRQCTPVEHDYDGNGSIDDWELSGAGMCLYRASPRIANNLFEKNVAWGERGGAMYLFESESHIVNNTFLGNTALEGGGVYAHTSDLEFEDCTFTANRAEVGALDLELSHGGAIHADGCSLSISNCHFIDNGASNDGAGLYSMRTSATVRDSTFEYNTGFTDNAHGAGIYSQTTSDQPTTLSVTNCTFLGNVAWTGGAAQVNPDTGPSFIDCNFGANEANHGGALFIRSQSTVPNEPVLENCVFRLNIAEQGGAVHNTSAATRFTSCTFEENLAIGTASTAAIGGGLYNWDSPVILNNCTFHENRAYGGSALGGGMANSASAATLLNCVFSHNSAVSIDGDALHAEGGGLHAQIGDPELTNCTFTNNTAGVGGGVANRGSWETGYSSPRFKNCIFNLNHAVFEGGGMSNGHEGSPELLGCSFFGNSSLGDGGAVHNRSNSNALVDRCTFESNVSFDLGGAITNSDNSTATILTCSFHENAAIEGGGICSRDYSHAVVDSCMFTDHLATTNGGAILNGANTSLELTSSTFENNYAFIHGGAISGIGSALSLSDSTFTANLSDQGGAISALEETLLSIARCTFTENEASELDGGAIVAFGSSMVETSGCRFDRNTSFQHGGAIHIDGSDLMSLNDEFDGNQARYYGGAIEIKNEGTLQMDDSHFVGGDVLNAQVGGAIDLDPSAGSARIENSSISNCSALDVGGGLYTGWIEAWVINCRICSNNAEGGAGVMSYGFTTHIQDSRICGNTFDQIRYSFVDEGGNEIGEDCCEGDLDNDGMTDGGDLSLLLSSWGSSCFGCEADMNYDGAVNGADLSALLSNWGNCP